MYRKYISGDYGSYEELMEKYRVNVPDNFNFAYDVVDWYAENEPDKAALVWCNDNEKERRFSFRELKELTDKTANFFSGLGIKKGDRVMLILKRRFEFWYCLLALHKIGAVAVPATHLLTEKDISYRNNAAGIKMIVAVAEEQVLKSIDGAALESETLKLKVFVDSGCDVPGGLDSDWIDFTSALEKESGDFQKPALDALPVLDDTSLLYFTSGTTGYPKMVQHDFAYPLGHIATAKYWQNVRNDGLHLTVADTGWAKAVWGKIYGQWLCGSAVFVYDMDAFVPANLLEKLEQFKVTTFCAPPTIYRFMLAEGLDKYDLSALEYCVVAGEPLNPEVYNQFRVQTGINLMEGYGQTELTLAVGCFTGMEPKPGSMGKPAPGYDIAVVDQEGNKCAAGDVGQIVIFMDEFKPVGLFKGYYRDEELTRSVYHDGIYYTGDTAWMDEDGFLWFVGRTDDVIKSSGYRIGPFEVESALIEHDAVLECAITAVPDDMRGQIVKATVVLGAGWKDKGDGKLVKELQEHVKKVTAPYKYPRIVEFVDELPKTISGKIRRVEIRDSDNS
ncbi:MAG: AMP-binding protein [Spirochaetales bacterium]|nr:AMP-binding protein [Spirochaetales bacterium]